jgi:hypothetical protein
MTSLRFRAVSLVLALTGVPRRRVETAAGPPTNTLNSLLGFGVSNPRLGSGAY